MSDLRKGLLTPWRRLLYKLSFSMTFWLLVLTVFFFAFEVSDQTFAIFHPCLDLQLQDLFFPDKPDHRFILQNEFWYTFLHNNVNSYFVSGVFGLLIVFGIMPQRLWTRLGGEGRPKRRAILIAVLCLASTASVVGFIKAKTHVYLPMEVDRYGGRAPFVHFFESYPDTYERNWRFVCFGHKWRQDGSRWSGNASWPGEKRPTDECGRSLPCGHSSSGFALMSLFFVFRGRRRWLGLGLGLACGSILGLSQMMNGNHYLSHVLFTGLISWILCLALRRWIPVLERGIRACWARRRGQQP